MSNLSIHTKNVRFPVAKNLYGLFFEDINRSGDSGLYPEMLRNRSFEDSIPPKGVETEPDGSVFVNRGGWPDIFNGGEGMSHWIKWPRTAVPAWYVKDATMALDLNDTLNEKREASLKVSFKAGGSLYNIGYHGINARKGISNHLILFIKSENDVLLHAALQSASGKEYCGVNLQIRAGDYIRYDADLTPAENDTNSRLVIVASSECELRFGFSSLLPSDTYKGHGLRSDIVEMLKNTHSKFLRFPGGCIVEGFNAETVMRFSNTVGPIWERPSHQLMWHYRTTNGLGFHEYLQLCEDLDLDPLYVCNVGMSCQARMPEYFDGEELDELLQECLDAIEYALGDCNTKWGKLRAEMGHPEPFKLRYIEIGNENFGPEYGWRYKKFYDVLKEKYPEIIYISNTHTEEDQLPTEVVDEHYYNTPWFFAENTHKFDTYDRKGPKIFLGEYAVASGETVMTHYAALGEAMFLTGVENNQDIVTLSSYAPLFQNIDFTAWQPNLIVFNNNTVYGIPTYHMISMMAEHRGENVVSFELDAPTDYLRYEGVPGLIAAKSGVQFKNPTLNGKSVSVSRLLQGELIQEGDTWITKSGKPIDHAFSKTDNPADAVWSKHMKRFQLERINLPGREEQNSLVMMTFGESAPQSSTFEIDVKMDADNAVSVSLWNHLFIDPYAIDEPKAIGWSVASTRNRVWDIRKGKSSVKNRNMWHPTDDPEAKPINFNYGEWNHLKVVTRENGYDCWLNGVQVESANLPTYPTLGATVSTDADEVIVKIVNMSGQNESVQISLDCDVQNAYQRVLLKGDPKGQNSLECPNNISPVEDVLEGASSNFCYEAPSYSVSILLLKKN